MPHYYLNRISGGWCKEPKEISKLGRGWKPTTKEKLEKMGVSAVALEDCSSGRVRLPWYWRLWNTIIN
ncbi:MAG: hypothetical protein K9L85_01455 [Candidatus Peribacteraceae bacterium]|nr:hypothetical protein [Candidatus Peribacteraceae bacterium]